MKKGENMKTLEEYKFNCVKHDKIRESLRHLSQCKSDNFAFDGNYCSHIDSEFKVFVETFLSATSNRFQFNDLERKLRTLEVGYISSFMSTIMGIYGYYDIDDHKISVSRRNVESIYHELFHAMSSFRANENINGCGFFQSINGVDIAYMFDEGYTDFLSYRYFENEISYNIAANMAYKIELMISREKMESMYSLNQLSGIISFLSQNSSLYNAIKFLMLLDKFGFYNDLNKKYISTFNALSNYLVDVYLKYLSKLYGLGKINRNTLLEKLELFEFAFVDHAFDDEDEKEYYLQSSEYFDIVSKLNVNSFQKTLKNS